MTKKSNSTKITLLLWQSIFLGSVESFLITSFISGFDQTSSQEVIRYLVGLSVD